MKRSTINMTFAAAIVMVASTVASAQTLTARIPFSFRAAGMVMAPGTYDLVASEGEHILQLSNVAAHAGVLLNPGVEADAPQAWRKAGKPTLEFTCRGTDCSLTRIWTAVNHAAHTYSTPRSKNDDRTLASIRLVNASVK